MNNINSAFQGTAGLTKDYYEALVTASMEPYRLSVNRAKTRQDTLEVESAVYTDLGTKMNALRDAVVALRQDDDSSVFDNKTATSSDSTYVTGTAMSNAADATYQIHVDNLAGKHRTWSDQQTTNFTLDLGSDGNTATFKIRSGSDSAHDIEITVSHGDGLDDIRDKINQTVQDALDGETLEEGYAFTASVVDNRLVIEAKSTGTAYELAASDTSGTVLADLNIIAVGGDTDADGNGFVDGNETAAEDAEFTANGISITRSSNTGIDDVITGVTFDLKKEHGTGNSDTIALTIAPDSTAVTSAINSFISKLNDFNNWMAAKSGVKENDDGTYTRGVLASNFGLKGLRRNLIQTTFATWADTPANATYTRLDQIGLGLGEGLTLSLDSSTLSAALSTDYAGVVALFDSIMEDVQTLVDPYTEGTNNQVDKYKASVDKALDLQSDKIERLEDANERRENLIRDQIAMQFAAISSYNDQGRFLMTTLYNTYA